MDPFYLAISLFKRKKFDECINVCNGLLQKDTQGQKGPWELKMRAMTQRVYVDDIEADDGVAGECYIVILSLSKFSYISLFFLHGV